MDPFHLSLALGPVSIYLLLIGRINLARRPFLTTGSRDTVALAIAVSGLAIVGPLDLFMPEGAAFYLGGWIWLPLIGLYGLVSLLAAMLMRPRLVVYNISVDQLRPRLEAVASQLDPDRRWAGTSLIMPNRGVQLTIEAIPTMRNVQLVSGGASGQDLDGWRRLELTLRDALSDVRVQRNPRGFSLVLLGIVMAAVVLYGLHQQPQEVARALDEFLRH